MKSIIALIGMALVMSFASMSANAQSGNVYDRAQIRGYAEPAQVLQVRLVTVQEQTGQSRAAGMAVGGTLGAVLGGAVARNSRSTAARILVAGLGAALGGYAGNRVSNAMATTQAQEVLVRYPNGRLQAIVQPQPAQELHPGDAVHVLSQGGQTRLILAEQPYRPSPTGATVYPLPQHSGYYPEPGLY